MNNKRLKRLLPKVGKSLLLADIAENSDFTVWCQPNSKDYRVDTSILSKILHWANVSFSEH